MNNYEYRVYGKNICRYQYLNSELKYSVVGDIYKNGEWIGDFITMNLRVNETSDFTTTDFDILKEYCSNNDINIFLNQFKRL